MMMACCSDAHKQFAEHASMVPLPRHIDLLCRHNSRGRHPETTSEPRCRWLMERIMVETNDTIRAHGL